jgi:endonuclease III
MDRQIRAEKAWMVPHEIMIRLGSFQFGDLERLSLEQMRSLFLHPYAIHRFPDVMAMYFRSAVQRIGHQYSGRASAVWSGRPNSASIVRRFLEFEGVGPKIATMAANILVRDFKVPVSDRISIDISVDVQVRRVFTRLGLVADGASQDQLVYRARELNPTYPGIFDLSAWEIGRNWCKAGRPLCSACYMNDICPTAPSLRNR